MTAAIWPPFAFAATAAIAATKPELRAQLPDSHTPSRGTRHFNQPSADPNPPASHAAADNDRNDFKGQKRTDDKGSPSPAKRSSRRG